LSACLSAIALLGNRFVGFIPRRLNGRDYCSIATQNSLDQGDKRCGCVGVCA